MSAVTILGLLCLAVWAVPLMLIGTATWRVIRTILREYWEVEA